MKNCDKLNTEPSGPDTQAAAGRLIKSSTAALALVVWSTVGVLLSVGKLVLYESYARLTIGAELPLCERSGLPNYKRVSDFPLEVY